MSTVVKDLGAVSAYAYAVEKGYTGTEAEFAELMADYAEVGQRAEDAADSALDSKTAAQTAATTATNKASEATTAATTATTKAAEASTSASTATSAKDTAVSASQTATSKASEATTAAATATSAKTDAVAANTAAQSAKTAAQTAQTGAETAAASVQSSAAQIQTNADDISELKEDLSATVVNPVTLSMSNGIINSQGIVGANYGGYYKVSQAIDVSMASKIRIYAYYYGSSISTVTVLDKTGAVIDYLLNPASGNDYVDFTIPDNGEVAYVQGTSSKTPTVVIYTSSDSIDRKISTMEKTIEKEFSSYLIDDGANWRE